MILLATLVSFISVVCLYGAAKKVELKKTGFLSRLEKHANFSRVASIVLLMVSTIFLTIALGIAKGIIYSVVIWTSIASLLLLFVPFLTKKKSNTRSEV